MKLSRRVVASLGVVLLLAACAGESSTSSTTETAENVPPSDATATSEVSNEAPDDTEQTMVEVVLGSGTTRSTSAQAPYNSLPLILGYWEEEGLDVTVELLQGTGAVIQAVEGGQLDGGSATPGLLFAAVEQGSDVIAFHTLVTRNFSVPSVPVDSDIQSVADFEGKRIGVQSLDSGTIPMIQAMAESAGVGAETLQFIDIGDGATALEYIQRGDVDVVGLSDSARSQIENFGYPLRVVATEEFEDLGFNFAMFAPREAIEANREVWVGIARGIAKATVFAEENPEAAILLNWQVYPEAKPSDLSDEEAMARELKTLQIRQSYTPAVDGIYGYTSPEDVITQIELAIDAGTISAELDVDDVWTSELLEEINDFDEEAVRQQAREYEVTE